MGGDLEPSRRSSLVRKSRRRNTLTEIKESDIEKMDQIFRRRQEEIKKKTEKMSDKESNPRLCIRPMVTSTEKERELRLWLSCGSFSAA